MECPNCHSPNSDRARYCEECGTRLSLTPENPPEGSTLTQTYPTPARWPVAGSVFAGRYLIIEELGMGGMGKVYRARDQKVNEVVALKLIRPEIASQPKVLERFRNELVTARRISHKHVGRMYELMEAEGIHFITMEYVPGDNLRVFIRRSREMTESAIIALAKQICEGLAEAHRLGIIHRDIKPSNIMIDHEGNAKIMDFGLARSFEGTGATSTGAVAGTPDYMSPEQVEGKELDAQSDIYSLGMVLYEMATGRLPFEGDTPYSVAIKHKLETPKPPKFYRPQISDGLNRLVLKCLAKDKRERYQNVAQIRAELDPVSTSERKHTRTSLSKEISLRRFFGRLRKKPGGRRKRVRRVALWASAILVGLYLSTFLIGFINDLIYRPKLEKIAVEYNTYFANLFPIKKDWLPPEWVERDCNAFSIYKKILPGVVWDEKGNELTASQKLNNPYLSIFRGMDHDPFQYFEKFKYSDAKDLKAYLDSTSKYFAYLEELLQASRCNRLNPGEIQVRNPLFTFNAALALKYTRYAILQSRWDILSGRYDKALSRFYDLLLIHYDLSRLSGPLISKLLALATTKLVYKELIVLMLSDQAPNASHLLDSIDSISRLILEDIDVGQTCYREYLSTGKFALDFGPREIVQDRDQSNLLFFLVGRFMVRKYGFSWWKAFYYEQNLYRELFERLKYIRSNREKSIFLKDYSGSIEEQKRYGSGYLLPNWSTTAFKHNIARMLIKTYLLVRTIRKYGLDSREFLSVKGSDLFINEFSGEPFRIVSDGQQAKLVLDESVQLSLKTIDYASEHKALLLSLKHFDPNTFDDIRSIFYSFEIEAREIAN